MFRKLSQVRRIVYFLGLPLLALAHVAGAQTGKGSAEWASYGGDPGGNKYSTLTQINKTNVTNLQVVWTWKTGEKSDAAARGVGLGPFEGTPLMVDGVLYEITSSNRVVALDPKTGKQLWSYDPHSYEPGMRGEDLGIFRGTVNRGVATWTDGKQRRIFLGTRWRLIGIDAKTGEPLGTFGKGGQIDLTEAVGWPGNKYEYDVTSAPVVFKNLVIISSRVPDPSVYHDNPPGPPPGNVMAFDVRTGKLVWTFRTIPGKGEVGNESWETDIWKYIGHANVWPPMALDDKRGLIYLPVTTPGDDYYGVNRPGNGLFGDSLVCLDANTGKLAWYFQTVHHGLWDYDGVMMPNLVTVHKDGQTLDLVAAVSKTGFTYVFDRVTGKPVWPIEERPVPQSDVPGEKTSPTQPFPTKPAPFAHHGFTLDDVVDFTPELKQRALDMIKNYRLGSMFTPPSYQGVVLMPNNSGGANWGGSSFDPETGNLYVKGLNLATVYKIPRKLQQGEPLGTVGISIRPTIEGIPINKPPYSTVTAINLNTGDHSWQRPVGDYPLVRNHPLLKGVTLPEELGAVAGNGNSGSLVTKGGLLVIAPGDNFMYFLDKNTGKTLFKLDIGPAGDGGSPMTYEIDGRQYIVAATGKGDDATVVAFALPAAARAR